MYLLYLDFIHTYVSSICFHISIFLFCFRSGSSRGPRPEQLQLNCGKDLSWASINPINQHKPTQTNANQHTPTQTDTQRRKPTQTNTNQHAPTRYSTWKHGSKGAVILIMVIVHLLIGRWSVAQSFLPSLPHLDSLLIWQWNALTHTFIQLPPSCSLKNLCSLCRIRFVSLKQNKPIHVWWALCEKDCKVPSPQKKVFGLNGKLLSKGGLQV